MAEEIKALLTKKKKKMQFPSNMSRILKLDQADAKNVVELIKEELKD